MIRSSVVFPHPLGPSRLKNEPAGISQVDALQRRRASP